MKSLWQYQNFLLFRFLNFEEEKEAGTIKPPTLKHLMREMRVTDMDQILAPVIDNAPFEKSMAQHEDYSEPHFIQVLDDIFPVILPVRDALLSLLSLNNSPLSFGKSYNASSEIREDVLSLLFTEAEMSGVIKACKNTAPGSDRLTYFHWTSFDPRNHLLSKLFNSFLHFQSIPTSWKQSITIRISVKDDLSISFGWHPIALSNTCYKLFMKCLRLNTYSQVLAFMDDIALLADSLVFLQDLLNNIISTLGQLSLKLNPRKSRSVMYPERPQRKPEILFPGLLRLACAKLRNLIFSACPSY
ncbi:reverse transcriptase domain-containing protein [Caerostris darwini]|uniref:Reverse transcriptase domain-containing protein n=1 Tax=Caerostris darwini TaxID=1538125 RepID=A0AAV4S6Z2_9ARAC|nr:reverse transcriptase domain-containing protein [Caerostris darwini]